MRESDVLESAVGLIGREGVPEAIAGLLRDYRLITLVGPGGVGKTTLANDLAGQVADRFVGGVYVAELAGVDQDDDLAAIVARQLDASSLEGLRLRSVGQPTLVVLDNCESALAASRDVAVDLTSGDSDITVVATSRSPLYALGERLFPVRPLSVADDESTDETFDEPSAAELLFLRRAKESGAAWPQDETNLSAVRQLTRQLNGLPLAIELAAARSRALGPMELVDLLDRQLDVLIRPGGMQERHHSLRSVIEASYEPLSEPLRHCLRSLSFISTPFDLRIAHAVVGSQASELDSLDMISQLIDVSLVDVRQTSSGKTEYLLLDSIRAFGHEQLTEAQEWNEVGERYVDAITAAAGDVVAAALESFSPEVMSSIRDIFSHLVNAITWCLDHDPSPARTYQMVLLFFGPTGASREIAELANKVRERWDETAPLQAEAYAVMGSLTFRTGRYSEGAELARAAIDHPDATDMAKLMGYRTLGYAAGVQRKPDEALQCIDAALPFALAFSEAFDREIRISRTAMIWDSSGSSAAIESLAEVLKESTEVGEWLMVVWSQVMMSYHHLLLGDAEAAVDSCEAALDVADQSGMAWATITANHNMAGMVALTRDVTAAAPYFRAALNATVAIGDLDGCAAVLRAAAGAALRNGDEDLAANLWATVPAHPGIPVPPSQFDAEEEQLKVAHGPATSLDLNSLVKGARTLLGAIGESAEVKGPDGSSQESSADRSISFGDYQLNFAMCELRCNGERIPLEPQVYDVLALLVERRGTVVTKHELLDEVWGDRFVSESALSSRIKAVRQATGDDGKAQRVIRTVHGRGYSFVADIDG
jgi:predicted ATPase/DNA-binding winged helix-turn-helix (wHTH) protein